LAGILFHAIGQEDLDWLDLPRFGGQLEEESAKGPWVPASQSTALKLERHTQFEIFIIF
jgi:hypothetical protein